MKNSQQKFNLLDYAENDVQGEVDKEREEKGESKLPSYDELMRTKAPEFKKFLSRLREGLKNPKEQKKKIFIVLGTGGTFQSAETDEGLFPSGSLKESFEALGLPEDPTIHMELCDLMSLDSSQMTVDQWRFLAEMIQLLEETASDMYDALIVTHGTDTMSKGAAYLSFMLKGFPKPIIFTGSQEPARKSDTDAKDQMDRSIKTAKIATNVNRIISEVMVVCGQEVTRGTWAMKLGDQTTNAFGPWNKPRQEFDATDWEKAAREGTLHRLAPSLLNFGTGKNTGRLEFSGHAIEKSKKGPYEPFTEITHPADIYPASLSDKSPVAFAQHIIKQNISVLIQLGSATADDRLVKIALKAVENGKLAFFQAPFHDSSVKAGTYAAGAEVKRPLSNIQGSVPIINTSPSALEAKSNYLFHKLGLTPAGETSGLGVYYTDMDLRMFFDHMKQNLVGELV